MWEIQHLLKVNSTYSTVVMNGTWHLKSKQNRDQQITQFVYTGTYGTTDFKDIE